MPESLAEMLARVKPRLMEDYWDLVLRPDLAAKHEDLEADLVDARIEDASRPSTMGTQGPSKKTKEIAEAVLAIKDEMAESAVRFVFRGLPRDEFRALCAEHPPREGDQYDVYVGYNREKVSDKLVRLSLIDPEPDDDSWADLIRIMGAGQWDELRKVAEKVNGSVIHEPPKSLMASEVLSPSAADSEPQPASA